MQSAHTGFTCALGALLVLAVFMSGPVRAADYYVDPAIGAVDNNGGSGDPWSTLQEVFADGKTFQAGDTVFLRNGHHGEVTVRGENQGYVTIKPQAGHGPTVKSITVSNAAYWNLSGLTVSPETAPEYEQQYLVLVNSSASHIVVENCFLYSVLDNSAWTDNDWVALACHGIFLRGRNNIARGNHLLNVDHGIQVDNRGNLVEHNVVENFSADGMRGLGDSCVFQYNLVKNCYNVDDNHDDGFQSWSVGDSGVGTGVVRGIVLRGNTFINYTDPNRAHQGPLQGIGCFDGFFEDWLVVNNVIITNHWHGLTLMGARNCRVINNTVVDINETDPGPPWIRISAHKNGSLSTGNIIRNNLSTGYASDDNIGQIDHNVTVDDYSAFFTDYAGYVLQLKEGCAAVNAGTGEGAPETDIRGVSRPQGGEVDAGAYEYTDASPVYRGASERAHGRNYGIRLLSSRTGMDISGFTGPGSLFLHDVNGTLLGIYPVIDGPAITPAPSGLPEGMYILRYLPRPF